ncbi:hypothetical protein VaNZ11_006294 [Volvox africanus]|uniref:Uncharacterized protein n=1 Tax=Volvox africanus TaxID=51714 RepID=A0ABQ5S0H8_9CHLO|nr:hypothetical protein VaNZ11_006294 [Volvox africanus]
MSTGQYYRVCRALLRSVQLSDTASSSGDEPLGGQLGGVSVSSSIERQTMREQLDAVRQTLNSLSSQAQPNSTGVNAAPAGLENALNEIAAKLSSIEGLYSSLTSKLEKVDLRVEDSERHIKELQHLSASAINETARLVDYVGGRSTPNVRSSSHAGAGPSGVSAGIGLRARNLAASGVPTTPPPHGMSPTRSTTGALDFVPPHLTSTIQQHAAQIHKVIAGLDFLEAHIIRQDQMVEALQKQVLSIARDVTSTSASTEGRNSPSELSMRVHDMSELLNKLRAHMYKVEKKTGNNDQALTLLTQRLQAVEQISGRQQHHRESISEQGAAVAAPSVLELVTAQEELRGMVQDLSRDVLELRDQLQAQQQAQAQQPSEPAKESPSGMSAEDSAEMRLQVTYLMSQVPDLVSENKELKEFAARASKRIDYLSGELEEHKRQQQEHDQQLEQQHQILLRTAPAEGTPSEGVVVELKATVAELQQQVTSLEGRLQSAGTRADLTPLPSVLQAIESSVAAIAELGSSLAVVQGDVAGLQDLAVVLREGLDERSKQTEALSAGIEALSAAVEVLTEEQSRSAAQQQPTGDPTAKLHRITEGSPEAAVLAAQVAASAKADLEEQFGQLRQRVEAAAAAAEAAEVAARSSAESASAASEALEAAGQADKAASASLQATVLTMVADLEQEQSTLKEQLAQLAAQISEEQAAISSGLLQVQEQVAAAASAATEATTCAQAVQEQQAARGQQERESAEQLRAMQAELREQVASVMERLKERVEQSMQQLSAVSDRLSSAVTAQQLETELEQLRTAAADTLERNELAAASLEEMRSELILLTGQQDVLQSRLQGVESVLGVDSRLLPRGHATESSTLSSTLVAEAERQEDREDAGPRQLQDGGKTDDFGGAVTLPVASAPPVGRGLLVLVTELQSRVGDLEGTLELVASDMCQLRTLMQRNENRTQSTIQEATAQLMLNLQDLSAVVDQRVTNAAADILAVGAASAALHQKVTHQEDLTADLATRIEGVQVRLENEVIARIHETSSTVSSLSARIAHDYVSREQLGAIFKARDNMKRAVDELASVFSIGRLLRTESVDDAANAAEPEASGAQQSSSGALSPRLVSALEDLAGKQAELEHQVQLALYRTEGAVRQEQLVNIQQAMLTLELQFRRLGVSTQASVPVPSETTKDLSDLRSRVETLEAAALATSANAAAVADAAAQLASEAAAAAEISSTPLPSEPAPGSALRVSFTPEDPANGSSPIRVRVLVESCEAAATPRLDVGRPDSPDNESDQEEEEGGEPSLSSMLHGIQTGRSEESISAASSPEAVLAAAAREAQSELRDMRRALQDLSQQNDVLRSEVASEVTERQRLAEALADLQERLDLQVNTTASTAAMIATMATDQPQDRVRLQVRVGATEAEADLSVLASTVSTLVARIGAAEEALASAFFVRTPRSPTRAAAADAVTESAAAAIHEAADGPAEDEDDAGQPGSDKDQRRRETEGSSEEGLRPALGMMVPVLPHEVEQQLVELQCQLSALTARVVGLEAVDALEEVRATASEAVLDAIPGLVSQQVAVLRDEFSALMGRQGEQLLEVAGQAARDAAEAVLAVREAAAQAAAAQAAAETAASGTRATSAEVPEDTAALVSTSGAQDEQAANLIRSLAVEAAREAVQDVCLVAAREVTEETVREVVVKAVAEELKDVRGAVESLAERINDVDTLRDQLEALAAQVREPITAPAAATSETDLCPAGASNAQGPPCTPTAMAVASIFTPATTALVIPPAPTPRRASPSAGGARPGAPLQQQSGGGGQQSTFLARLVEVVKRQSSRLHAQYSDAEETGMALAQVNHTLQEAEARLADVRDANSPAFAETLVTVLEQVAALRYIGSQTHPAVQQMVLEHENRLDKIAEDLKAISGGSPRSDEHAVAAAAAAQPHPLLVEEIGVVSRQVARMEAELARVAGQNAALDRAVKEMIVQLGSLSPSAPGSLAALEDATATGSRRVSAHEGEVLEMESEALESAIQAGTEPLQAQASTLEEVGLAVHVRLVEGMLEAHLQGLRHELMGEIRARAGSGGGAATVTAATTAAELGELEKTVSKLHSAVTAIRNRLLAMQEYVDSTQGMIKDMHIALGGLVRRVDTLEAASGSGSRSARVSGCGSVSVGGADAGNLRDLQSDLHKFERRLLTMESSSLEAAHALASLKGLTPRVTEVESRLLDACSKLAVALGGSPTSTAPVIPAVAPGTSLPAVAGTLRALERRLGSRLEAACGALDTLGSALSAAGRIQAESTANPFKAISAAVNNPVIVAMEKKLETMRAEILAAATSLSEDMRRDHQQHQLESRLASADTSVGGGSAFRL